MGKRIITDPKQLNMFIKLLKRIGYIPRLLKDPMVKIWNKLAVILMLVYLISPVDFIPEAILGLGILDDTILTIITLGFLSDSLDNYIRYDMNKKSEVEKNIHEKIIENVDYEVND